jgi:hypothetical protein
MFFESNAPIIIYVRYEFDFFCLPPLFVRQQVANKVGLFRNMTNNAGYGSHEMRLFLYRNGMGEISQNMTTCFNTE